MDPKLVPWNDWIDIEEELEVLVKRSRISQVDQEQALGTVLENVFNILSTPKQIRNLRSYCFVCLKREIGKLRKKSQAIVKNNLDSIPAPPDVSILPTTPGTKEFWDLFEKVEKEHPNLLSIKEKTALGSVRENDSIRQACKASGMSGRELRTYLKRIIKKLKKDKFFSDFLLPPPSIRWGGSS